MAMLLFIISWWCWLRRSKAGAPAPRPTPTPTPPTRPPLVARAPAVTRRAAEMESMVCYFRGVIGGANVQSFVIEYECLRSRC